MLRRYTPAQTAEKLGLDESELRFLLLHFREFVTPTPHADSSAYLADEDLHLLRRVFKLIRNDGMDPSDIRTLLRAELNGHRSSGSCQGGILVFSSGRRETGKSSLIWNLAFSLAHRGYRVTIFDGAVGPGGIGSALSGSAPNTTSAEWEMDFESGVKLILGDRLLAHLPAMPSTDLPEEIVQNIREIDSGSDFLLIDAGEGNSDNALRYAVVAEETVIVTTPNVAANADCFAIIRMLKDVDPDTRIGIVINKAQNINDARESFARINGAGKKVKLAELDSLGWIAEDEALRRYMADGIPLVEALPTSMASRCIDRLADHLAHRLNPVARRTGGISAAVQAFRVAVHRERSSRPTPTKV